MKVALASLVVGAILSALDIRADQILAQAGLTPKQLLAAFQSGAEWALPNILLGMCVTVPAWFVFYLLRPYRD